MNSIDLIKQIIARLKKFSWVFVITALLLGILFYFFASRSVKVYTSRATIFPLNNSSVADVGVSSTITNVLGITDQPKSFTGDASINIIELAGSRTMAETVATSKSTLMPSLHNRQIVDILIDENNKNSGFLKASFIDTTHLDNTSKINIAIELLRSSLGAKINKNGLLEFIYNNTNPDIVKEVSYIYVDNISKFYIDLKKKKAQLDYDFAVKKVDSLAKVSSEVDNTDIHLDETTFFTKDNLKRYTIPKVNLEQKKQTLQSQFYYAVNNREQAAYRLQKETPIIQFLDKPDPPYDFVQKSKKTYTAIGLILGFLLGAILVSWKIFANYIKLELKKLEKPTAIQNTNEAVVV